MNHVRFHCMGRWTAGEVFVRWTPETRRRVPQVDEIIESAWKKASARLGDKLFDGPMCRLESFDAGKNLTLNFSLTSYKAFLGTNLGFAYLADKYGQESLANPMGVSSALETSDGFVMLGRRNASVAYYPLRVHPFA